MVWDDDIIYVCLLLLCIGFGHVYRKIEDVNTRQWISTLVGFLVVLIPSGIHVLHPLFVTLVNAVIILGLSPRYCHITSFSFTFAYLLFFRTTHYFGIPYPPPHTNAIQMMLTLKMVGLALEVTETHTRKKQLASLSGEELEVAKAELEFQGVEPTFLNIFHYSFTYVGILTGPYFKYRTYMDHLKGPFSQSINCLDATLNRIKVVPMYAALYLVSGYLFPLKYAESEEIFTERSVLYRIWYMTPIFFNFRMRIYSGFVLSECACIMSGLGAYPTASEPRPGQGPTKYKVLKQIYDNPKCWNEERYNFEAIHNIDEYGSDFVPTVREGMRCWNMTVQYWLAVNVYKRVTSKSLRTVYTLAASAFWHGVYAGYYLSLVSAGFVMPVESQWEKLYRRDASEKGKRLYDWIQWFLKMQWFSYMGMAFLLLHIRTTVRYWHSIYYVVHILNIVFYVLGLYLQKTKKREQRKVQDKVE